MCVAAPNERYLAESHYSVKDDSPDRPANIPHLLRTEGAVTSRQKGLAHQTTGGYARDLAAWAGVHLRNYEVRLPPHN